MKGLRLCATRTEFGEDICTAVEEKAVNVMLAGFVSPCPFVLLIVETPTVLSDSVVVPTVCPCAIVTLVGEKVPCVAEGVITTPPTGAG